MVGVTLGPTGLLCNAALWQLLVNLFRMYIKLCMVRNFLSMLTTLYPIQFLKKRQLVLISLIAYPIITGSSPILQDFQAYLILLIVLKGSAILVA